MAPRDVTGFLGHFSLSNAVSAARRTLRRFRADKAGVVGILFGLTLIPMLGFVGGAIDFANAYQLRSKLQNAVDAATLAAGREIDLGASQSDAQTVANRVLQSNLGEGFPLGVSANFSFNGKVVTADASLNVDTYILGVVGVKHFPIAVTSTVNISGGTMEVALVLDNSGSMSGRRLRDLKDAAKRLTQILYQSDRSSDGVKMAVVPFAAAVNVGSGFTNASWMDRTGESSIHAENFDANVTRWDMFSAMRGNQRWAGCVEVRPAPYDTSDAAPVSGDSLFVPMFAPDEPDGAGWWSAYNNSYLDDDDGSCGRPPNGETDEQAQEKTCKYQNERPSGGQGPNYMCDPQALLPLTDIQGQVVSAIENMRARGMTNILEGVMWGWRVLSPGEPFTEGRDYSISDNRKFMIVMTDGANTHTGSNNQNMSRYSAFGYAKSGRLRSPTSSTSSLVNAMNTKTLEGCNNAKASDITVFTIAFNVNDRDTVDMLRSCASSNSRAFTIDNGSALIAVFEAIANELNRLRITS